MKNFLAIKILFLTFTYPIPTNWEALTPAQVLRILNILRPNPSKLILVHITIILLTPSNSFLKKMILFFCMPTETLHQLLPYAKKFTEEIKLAPDQIKTIGKKYHCKDMKKITFGQFIDADEYLKLNKIEHLLARLYINPNSKKKETNDIATDLLKIPLVERYAAYLQFMNFRNTVIERLNTIAARYPSDSTLLAPEFSWQDVIFCLSETAINIKDYSQLPLVEAIAEIEYKAKTAYYTRKNMEKYK